MIDFRESSVVLAFAKTFLVLLLYVLYYTNLCVLVLSGPFYILDDASSQVGRFFFKKSVVYSVSSSVKNLVV